MQPQIPLTRDIVFVGGGHAHALVLRMWGMKPLPGARLTLISPDPTAAYSGMLPGHVAGHYPRAALQIDLVKLARHAGARLILGRATGIDRAARRVQIDAHPAVAYDVLSLDIGISSEMPSLPGFAEHAVPAKPLDAFADRWEAFADTAAAGAKLAVIGGGVAGVELALAAAQRLGPQAQITLIEAGTALSAVGQGARRALLRHLRRAGIALLEGVAVAAVEQHGVRLDDGHMVPSDFTLGAAATRAQGWLGDTGLSLHDGFVRVDEYLRSLTDPAVFASGDIAHLTHAPRPKAGVFAVREAPVLLHNLTVAATGSGAFRPYRPQRDYLKLVSAGAGHAVADKWGLPLDGAWLWRWKDRIDRKFMARFDPLPAMPRPALPDPVAAGVAEELGRGKPLCGGCGAKVGRADLSAALAELPPPRRSDVIWGAGDDSAILKHGTGAQVLTTDHVRAFTEDPWLLARITAVHALGDVWSMGARPQAALIQVILPRMSPRLQTETLREIMAAAAEVFGAEGADVVGGHTSLGAELTVGYTVTGLCDEAPITQAGARAGDALILTKPIGTGVILAAEMAKAAPGGVVAAALASMARPQGLAARALAPHAHAMTDVTGFGLAGHLMGLLEASGVAATLDLAAVPVLAGAEALSAAGHGSTLLPANRQVMARMFLTEGARADLLFDPQTAGGLLASVPADRVADVLARLADSGERAAVIGTVTDGVPFLTVEG
ncbi:selenide, water dikinase SelD [Defluviimonas sp. WL0002]|uniref:Selenide, water dikinase SelD n=1 Tax=Albidovulum marisflavi TaxID=2984159 RepID=A0ABT2Z963_9RHOB|nr:selenide, water dikinase SelD [Defluviimonas sp. WL0002]MCV2867674.1 selenide, water dikinase SelD [Defluviimonas sp. WL0002]